MNESFAHAAYGILFSEDDPLTKAIRLAAAAADVTTSEYVDELSPGEMRALLTNHTDIPGFVDGCTLHFTDDEDSHLLRCQTPAGCFIYGYGLFTNYPWAPFPEPPNWFKERASVHTWCTA